MFDSLKKKEKTIISAEELSRFTLSFLISDGEGD
jgi:hypothetical protein